MIGNHWEQILVEFGRKYKFSFERNAPENVGYWLLPAPVYPCTVRLSRTKAVLV